MEIAAREARYLKLLYEMGGTGRLKHVAASFGVKPATAAEVLAKLVDYGLVVKAGWGRYRLTQRGLEAARLVTMKHRVLESFLTWVLGYSVEEACILASVFEHSIPTCIVARLYESLKRPCSCPHGKPITPAWASEGGEP